MKLAWRPPLSIGARARLTSKDPASRCSPGRPRGRPFFQGILFTGILVGNAAEPLMRADEIEGVLSFLRAAERLKTVLRSAWTSEGQQESVAEHTWRLCLMAVLLYGHSPRLDLGRLLKMCLIHDLGEAIGGDVPAPAQLVGTRKADRER